MNSILLLSFFYTPALNARSFRWTSVAEYLVRSGFSVDVVCAWRPGLSPDEVIKGVHIHRTGYSKIEKLRSMVGHSRTAGAPTGVGESTESHHGAMTGRLFSFIRGRIWRNLCWPDTACPWILPALKRAQHLCRQRSVDTLIASAPPQTGVLVGWMLKKTIPGLHWIVDLGDPFSFLKEAPPNNYRLYRRINVQYERKVFSSADAVSVTNPSTQNLYQDLFPEFAGKIKVIPPLLTMAAPPKKTIPAEVKKGGLHLVYVGTLIRSIRNPLFLLRLFIKASERFSGPIPPKLHFYGDPGDCRDIVLGYVAQSGGRILFHGLVPREVVTRTIHDADALVNIGNDTRYQLPSKVVEYLAAGKPIVNIVKSPQDSSALFLKGFDGVLQLIDIDRNPTQKEIEDLHRLLRRLPMTLDMNERRERLQPYRIESIGEAYVDLIQRGPIWH